MVAHATRLPATGHGKDVAEQTGGYRFSYPVLAIGKYKYAENNAIIFCC